MGSCSCPSPVMPSPWPEHPQVAHISHHLHALDPQFLPAHQVEVHAAAARAAAEMTVTESHRRLAVPAAPLAGNLHDLEGCSLDDRSAGGQVEAESHRVRNHRREPPDLDDHAHDGAGAYALAHLRHDRLAYGQLVHRYSSPHVSRTARAALTKTGSPSPVKQESSGFCSA